MTNPSFPDDASTWNKRFEGEDYVFGTEPNAYLREHAAQWRPGSRLLCVADGEGRNSVWLAASRAIRTNWNGGAPNPIDLTRGEHAVPAGNCA